MIDLSTPAGRLLAAFERVQAVDAQTTYRQVWARGLGYEQGTFDEIAHMSELSALLQQIYADATSVADSELGYDRNALLGGFGEWSLAIFAWGKNTDSNHQYSGSSVISRAARDTLAAAHNQLRAVVREGTFMPSQRDAVLAAINREINELLDGVRGSEDLPEEWRVRLIERLVDVRETVRMAQYRGDQAVVTVLQRADVDFAAAAQQSDSGQTAPDAPDIQARLVSWSETIRALSWNASAALSVPAAALYWLITKDAVGTSIIGSAGSPAAISAATQRILEIRNPPPPQELPPGTGQSQ